VPLQLARLPCPAGTSSGSRTPCPRATGRPYTGFGTRVRIDFPLASLARAWKPKTFYAWTDVEPIWRSDSGRIDPLRWRTGLGYIVSSHLIAEFQYYAQWTQPDNSGLKYTGNIIRVNFKIMTKRGLLPQQALRSLLDNNIDE
jgi:hypothetical protein